MQENIVQKVCKELNINQAELAKKLKVSRSTITDWNKGNIPKMTQYALELLIENIELKTQLKTVKDFYDIMGKIKI